MQNSINSIDSVNESSVVIFVVLGSLLIFQYYLLYTGSNKNLKKFWTNNGRNGIRYKHGALYNAYLFSLILSMLFGIYLFAYLGFLVKYSDDNSEVMNTVAIAVILGFSLMWIPSIAYGHYTSIVLLMVSVGFLLLLVTLALDYSNKYPANNSVDNSQDSILEIVALVACSYLF